MEQEAPDCVDLDAACQVLVERPAVQALIKREIGAKKLQEALTMMKAGKLEGDVGDEIFNLLTDEIDNNSEVVWEDLIDQPHDVYPVQVLEYHGVYWAWAMEYDPVGFFLGENSAVSYARSTWILT